MPQVITSEIIPNSSVQEVYPTTENETVAGYLMNFKKSFAAAIEASFNRCVSVRNLNSGSDITSTLAKVAQSSSSPWAKEYVMSDVVCSFAFRAV